MTTPSKRASEAVKALPRRSNASFRSLSSAPKASCVPVNTSVGTRNQHELRIVRRFRQVGRIQERDWLGRRGAQARHGFAFRGWGDGLTLHLNIVYAGAREISGQQELRAFFVIERADETRHAECVRGLEAGGANCDLQMIQRLGYAARVLARDKGDAVRIHRALFGFGRLDHDLGAGQRQGAHLDDAQDRQRLMFIGEGLDG